MQAGVELVLRLFTFRNYPYKKGLDVHEYLDESLIEISKNEKIDWNNEEANFKKTFDLLNEALGVEAFKRWDGKAFGGKFLMSLYETVAFGVSKNISNYEKLPKDDQIKIIVKKAKALWKNPTFVNNSGAGIRGTTRLINLLPTAFFKVVVASAVKFMPLASTAFLPAPD